MSTTKKFGTLTKVSQLEDAKIGKDPLRTSIVTGYFFEEPKEGSSFLIFSEPLNKKEDHIRQVSTSVVCEVTVSESKVRFKTMNSVYELVILNNHQNEN